jgi:hypothetical protein
MNSADGKWVIVSKKPSHHATVKLLRSHIDGTAMACTRYFPERYISRVVGTNPFGLLGWNVVICQPVYQ